MTELVFPLAATLALVLIGIPVTTVICKLLLLWSRPPATAVGMRQGGSSGRYLLLVAPVVLPAVWLVSAVAHHAEAEEAALICVFDHLTDASCAEPLLIAIATLTLLAASFGWRRRQATRAVLELTLADDAFASARVDAACASSPRLTPLRAHVRLVEGDGLRTVGLLRRRVDVGVDLARRLGVSELTAALLHEHEHVHCFDPLRFVVATMCQSLNPASALLADELSLWRAGREAVCDEAAVHRGADPCALAEALLTAARPSTRDLAVSHLGGGGIEMLRARITLLMGYIDAPPRCHCSRSATKIAALALTTLAVLPHYWGQHVIVDLHQGAERMVVDSGLTR